MKWVHVEIMMYIVLVLLFIRIALGFMMYGNVKLERIESVYNTRYLV